MKAFWITLFTENLWQSSCFYLPGLCHQSWLPSNFSLNSGPSLVCSNLPLFLGKPTPVEVIDVGDMYHPGAAVFSPPPKMSEKAGAELGWIL